MDLNYALLINVARHYAPDQYSPHKILQRVDKLSFNPLFNEVYSDDSIRGRLSEMLHHAVVKHPECHTLITQPIAYWQADLFHARKQIKLG